MKLSANEPLTAAAYGWFSELPPTWTVHPVRVALTEKNLRNEGQVRQAYLSLVSGIGVIPYEEKGDIGNKKLDDLSNCKWVDVGDFVINSMNFLIGGFGRSGHQGVCSAVYVVAQPNEKVFDPRFLMRVFQVSEFQRHVGRLGKGIMALRMAIGWEELKNQPIPAPPLKEQERIANFLDEQTARIDALIAEKERLLTTLEEWRAAELSRLCFGLDGASVETGNPWIPFLPKGWRLARLKHLIYGIEQGWSPECEARLAADDQWGVLKAGAANGGTFRDTEHKALPSHLEPVPELEVKAGDVLVTRASGSADLVGSFAFVYSTRPQLMLSDKNFRLKFGSAPLLMPELLAWMCNTYALKEQILQFVSGSEGLAKNIGSGSLRELWLAVPPAYEQAEILKTLNDTRLKLDSLKGHLTEHIERLREYRSSLISAAVTGQLDVSNSQLHKAA